MAPAPSLESALQFVAYVHRRPDRKWNIRFPDAEECIAEATEEAAVPRTAAAALERHLREQLDGGRRIDWPAMHLKPRADEKRVHVDVPPGLAIALQVRRLRAHRGWSQTELARRVGVSQQQIAKVEDPDTNPTVDTISKLAAAFSEPLVIVFGGSSSYHDGI
jgi:DNA-binding XRE family transcriptional regulator